MSGKNQANSKYSQDDITITKFSSINGFKYLTCIRGLEKVTVENRGWDVNGQEVTDFEVFLNRVLILPAKDPKVFYHCIKRPGSKTIGN